jgi:hypothetical protein
MSYQFLLDKGSRTSIGIRRLHQSNTNRRAVLKLNTGLTHEPHNKASRQSRNFVSIQELKVSVRVCVVEHDAIRVAVQGGIPNARLELEALGLPLFNLDKVGAAIVIELVRLTHGRVEGVQGLGLDSKGSDEFPHGHGTHAIRRIHMQGC